MKQEPNPFAEVPSAVKRVYLDNAATTWPKCPRALEAAFEFAKHCGATSGRGAYSSAILADCWLQDARRHLSTLIGADAPQSIAICHSGTHALNVGLHGILQPGQHVITTDIEHNSVLRPLEAMCQLRRIEVSHARSDACGVADVEAASRLLRPNTSLICVGHASNVTGAVQDLPAWRCLADACGGLLMVDASQTLGYVPLDVMQPRIDLLAAAAHKGLRALSGSGFLYVHPELQGQLEPLMLGGTGRSSESITDRPIWPNSVEVGNLNMLAVVSMAVAAEVAIADPNLFSSWRPAFQQLQEGLRTIPGLELLADRDLNDLPRVPVLSLLADGWQVHNLASILDTSFGIEARAGWHCAALIHANVGSKHSDGTLRLSTGHATSIEDIDYTLAALHEIMTLTMT